MKMYHLITSNKGGIFFFGGQGQWWLKTRAPRSDWAQSGHTYNTGKSLVKPVTASPKKMILKLTWASSIFHLWFFSELVLVMMFLFSCKNLWWISFIIRTTCFYGHYKSSGFLGYCLGAEKAAHFTSTIIKPHILNKNKERPTYWDCYRFLSIYYLRLGQ